MVLGRLAAEVAKIIRGKHKPMYTPHMDTGDNVIVINASKVRVTGRRQSRSATSTTPATWDTSGSRRSPQMLEKHPERVIEKAVYGMLPKTALGRQSLRRKLRVFANAKHSHAAQQPQGAGPQQEERDEVMADSSHHAHDRPPQGSGLPPVPQARLGQVAGQRTHARRLFPASAHVSAIQQPFTATDTLGRFDVMAKRRRRRTHRPGRCASPRRRPRPRQAR